MFNSDIEKRIINFIKKSPIGVTSTEIARYLDINRITLAKYLSVIKERALIDFKQLGMAKLWYIPVEINETSFLRKIVIDIVSNIDGANSKKAITKSGLEMGKHIEEIYKNFYNVPKLNMEQVCSAIEDFGRKIGADFKVIEKDDGKITIRNDKCYFGAKVKKCQGLCTVTSNILGTLAAKNFGYGKVVLKKTIAKGADEDLIVVYTKKSSESDKEVTTEYYPDVG